MILLLIQSVWLSNFDVKKSPLMRAFLLLQVMPLGIFALKCHVDNTNNML